MTLLPFINQAKWCRKRRHLLPQLWRGHTCWKRLRRLLVRPVHRQLARQRLRMARRVSSALWHQMGWSNQILSSSTGCNYVMVVFSVMNKWIRELNQPFKRPCGLNWVTDPDTIKVAKPELSVSVSDKLSPQQWHCFCCIVQFGCLIGQIGTVKVNYDTWSLFWDYERVTLNVY